MSLRRAPNPNRNHPTHCPYCGGEDLWPNEETEFAWKCGECLRIFEVKFYGQDDATTGHAPAPSTDEALQRSLARHGHDAVLRGGTARGEDFGQTGTHVNHEER